MHRGATTSHPGTIFGVGTIGKKVKRCLLPTDFSEDCPGFKSAEQETYESLGFGGLVQIGKDASFPVDPEAMFALGC